MPSFEYASRSSKGARSYQEDTAFVWSGDGAGPSPPVPPGSGNGEIVAVLADGMGGHAGGALASRRACEAFLESCKAGQGRNRERLVAGLRAANSAIASIVEQNPLMSGMGSTLIGTVFGSEGVEWVSVGDSPLMLYRNGEIALLNEDHSLAPELDRLVSEGVLTEEEARRDPRRHMLRSAVTGEEIDLVDVSKRPLPIEQGDYVILASDGLQTLEQSEVERIIAAYSADGAEAVADALIRAVDHVRDPHQDNTTVVAVRIIEPGKAETAS